jgi:ribulose-phosphate 3-epimerase
MRELGIRVGVAANPDTPFSAVEPFLAEIDLLLLMTVFPGFGGQSFMAEVMPKVTEARHAIDQRGLAVDLEVDGGIDVHTVTTARAAGANVFVAGSAIFAAADPLRAAGDIRRAAQQIS